MSFFKNTASDSHADLMDERFRRLSHELTRTQRISSPSVFSGVAA